MARLIDTLLRKYRKFIRKLLLSVLARSTPQKLMMHGEKRLLQAFRRAAHLVPAYRQLLREHGVEPRDIRLPSDFYERCPVLDKDNTFTRFPLHELCVPGALHELASVLTSSGQSGRFAFGLSSWKQIKDLPNQIDLGLQYSFAVDDKRTLLINCLPMGVGFSSNTVTIAQTSVREDMVIALVAKFGPYFEQIILVSDPLFLKRVVDYARDRGFNWSAQKIHVIIGEETFGENYRDYVANQLGINCDDPASGIIGSSMGVGELGLNLFYETVDTIRLRRLAWRDPEFFKALFGLSPANSPLPMLFVYNPLRIHVEILDSDEQDYGQLTVSIIDLETPLPLLRYQPGDIGRLLPVDTITAACAAQTDRSAVNLHLPLIAITGRDRDRLKDATHVGQYKDALYADKDIADRLTGGFRLEYQGNGKLMVHLQLRQGLTLNTELQQRLCSSLPAPLEQEQLRVWPWGQFPFGMTLDYERKFAYFQQPEKQKKSG